MTFCLWRCLCLTAPLYTYLLNTKNTNSSTKHCNICEWCPMSLFFEGLQWMLRLLFLSVRNIMSVSMFKSLLNCFLSVFYFWLWLFFGWVISPVGYLPGALSLWLSFCWSSHASTYSSQSVSERQGHLQSCHTNIKTLSYCIPSVYKLRWIWSKCWGSGGNSRLHPAQVRRKLKIAVREKMWKYSFLIQLKAVCSQKPFRIILGLLKHLVQPPHVTTKTIHVM